MPQTQRFLIAPYATGLQRDLKPWLIAEEAFEELQNVYVWRGRIKKRVGSCPLIGDSVSANTQLLSRLRIKVGTTESSGNLMGTVPGSFAVSPSTGTLLNKLGCMFSVGQQMLTVYQPGVAQSMLNTGTGTGTYDTTNGAYVLTGVTASTDVYFYPALPVMGFAIVETDNINFERYVGFDTQFSYEFTSTGGWQRLATGAALWTGDDADFFYSSMYRGITPDDIALFTTNGTPSNTGDGIRYFLSATSTWTQLTQSYAATANTLILGARIVIQFKNRLLLFNTFEQPGSATTVQYMNRVRYSQFGDPTQTDSWYDFSNKVYGKGGFEDAPIQQQIIACQILRDRMIVYFERSTWELVYTNNEIVPFRWQSINIELGAESTFSEVPFNKGIMGIGDVGIHVTNGIDVQRIDDKIPDQVFEIQNTNNGPERVQGIRDYEAELVYWSMPVVDTSNTNLKFPNQILVYNYKNDSWAQWDDSITAFGYININTAVSWGQMTYLTWGQWNDAWGSGSNQSRMLRVLAGNQQGYTFYLDKDENRNAASLQISQITVSSIITLLMVNNNLTTQDWILIENVQGTGTIPLLNGKIYAVIAVTGDNVTIVDSNVSSGSYTGGGTVARVSQINMLTKQYNFFIDRGINFSINQVDFLVDRTDLGEVTVSVYPSSGNLRTQSMLLSTHPYDTKYYPYEGSQDMLWHTIYPRITGSYIQFRIEWNPDQMINTNISLEYFALQSMLFYATPTDNRFQ